MVRRTTSPALADDAASSSSSNPLTNSGIHLAGHSVGLASSGSYPASEEVEYPQNGTVFFLRHIFINEIDPFKKKNIWEKNSILFFIFSYEIGEIKKKFFILFGKIEFLNSIVRFTNYVYFLLAPH